MAFKKVSFRDKETLIRSALNRVKPRLPKEDFVSSAPSPFVGRFGYPDINLGILTTPEVSDSAWKYDAPKFWSENNFQIPELVGLRAELINSRFKVNVKKVDDVIYSVQEIALARRPVDVEVHTDKPPKVLFRQDSFLAPTGAAADLKKFDITSNPKVLPVVQKFHYDTDCRSAEALSSLFRKGVDESALTRMLSVGAFGLKKNRKLVPTRWSITATDDTLGKDLLKKVRDFKESDHLSFFGGYLGNYYLILFFSGIWSFELFEMYVSQKDLSKGDVEFSSDFEGFEGRKSYAESCAGGYYANRLGVLEKLSGMKRQAGVLALRFITDEYILPLGVWICRQSTRKALKNKPLEFASGELMLLYAEKLAKRKFGFDLKPLLARSKLLRTFKQKRLSEF